MGKIIVEALGYFVIAVLTVVAGIYTSPSPETTDLISMGQRFSFLLVGLGLLATMIVLVAIFIKRKARDVIVLKNQLAAIYVAALKESALNPHQQQHRSARLSPTLTIQE